MTNKDINTLLPELKDGMLVIIRNEVWDPRRELRGLVLNGKIFYNIDRDCTSGSVSDIRSYPTEDVYLSCCAECSIYSNSRDFDDVNPSKLIWQGYVYITSNTMNYLLDFD